MSDFTMFGSLLPAEIPELEPLGLRTEVATIRHPVTRQRMDGLRIYGPGTAEHHILLEELGFKFDRNSGSFMSTGPVDRQRLLLAFPVEQVQAIGPDLAPPQPAAEAPVSVTKPLASNEAVSATLAGTSARAGLFSPAPRPALSETVPNDLEIPHISRRAEKVEPKAQVIGVNADDYTVYQAANGERFFRVLGDDDVYEDEQDDKPGLFLRAPSIAHLVVVARGLISPAMKGRAIPADEAARYLSAVNETRSNPFTVQDLMAATYQAVEQVLDNVKSPEQGRAIAARLHRFTGGSFASSRSADQAAFPIFNALREISADNRIGFTTPGDAVPSSVVQFIEANRDASGAGRTLIEVTGFGEQTPSDQIVRRVLGDIPSHYVIEGCQFIAEPLADQTQLFISIGARRPESVDMAKLPIAVFQVGYASEPEALSSWLEGVSSASAVAAAWFEAIRRGEVKADTIETIEQNRWQVPARPLSKSGNATMMVPVNLQGALEEAQNKFIVRHPEGMDEYVARAMRRPASSLSRVFLPEQIDSLGFDLDAEERRRGFMVGSLTGTGKGRIAAGRILISKLAGKRLLVLTERTVGLGTLSRDLINIGAFSKDVGNLKIALLNAGPDLQEAAGGTVMFPARTAKQVREQFMPDNQPAWPEGVDIVMGTYSGFNRDVEDSWRTAWLEAVVNKNVHLVLDESHNVASAESMSAENMVNAIAAAGHTMYLSATYASSGDKTGPYFSLLAPDADAGLATILPKTISNAGEAGHEEFGNLLARDGAMVRFEHSFEEIEFSLEVSPNIEDNRGKLDLLAPVIREMLSYAKVVNKVVAMRNVGHVATMKTEFEAQKERFAANLTAAEQKSAAAQIREEWKRVRKNGTFRTMSFGSPLYRIQRAFNASVMVSDPGGVVAGAIEHLRSGRKPSIIVDQTSESTINDVRKMAEEMGVEAPVPGFKHLLHQVLKTMGRAANGNNERIDIAVDRTVDEFRQAREIAQEITEGLCAVALEANEANLFDEREVDQKTAKSSELFRDWLDKAVPEAVAATITAIDAATGQVTPPSGRAKIKAIIGIAIEDSFMTTATRPAEIISNIRKHVSDFTANVDVGAVRTNVADMIEALPDMPISFIDVVKHQIEAAGFKVGEITGRQTAVDASGNIVPRKREQIESVRDRFNSGDYEAAILNSAGASMIDMHSDEKFKNQGQRVMMILQIPPAATLVQMLGRFHRIGQVVPPRVELHINGMPTEVRFIANMNQNLARMNANLASIRRHPLMCEAVPPLLTRDGDIATARVLLSNKAIIDELGLDIAESTLERLATADSVTGHEADDDTDALSDGRVKNFSPLSKAGKSGIKSFSRLDNRRLANEVLSRATILPAAAQSDLLREVQAQYNARIEEREALGLDTGGVKMVEGKVIVRAKRMLDLGDGDKPSHLQSAFRAPLSLSLVTIESSIEPIRGKEVLSMVNRSVTRGEDRLLSERIAYFERTARNARQAAEDGGVLAAIDDFQANRAALRAEMLGSMPIGGGLTTFHDGERVYGVIVGYRDQDFDPAFDIAVPGVGKTKTIFLSAIASMHGSHTPWPGIIGAERKKTLKMFDEASELSKVEVRAALTGNNWSAVQLDAGKIVTWANTDGSVSRGVLMPKTGRRVPPAVIRFTSTEQFLQVLEAQGDSIDHHVSVPLLPWSNGVDSHGIDMEVAIHSSRGRGAAQTTTYLAVNFVGSSTSEGLSKASRLVIAEKHVEPFLTAAGGIVPRLIGDKAVADIRAAVASYKALADGARDIDQIVDPAERSKTRRRCRAAEKLLREGIPLQIKQMSASGNEAVAVIDQGMSVLQQVFDHGLVAIRRDQIYLDLKAKHVRNWLLNGSPRPADMDSFVEVNEAPLAMVPVAQQSFRYNSAPTSVVEVEPALPAPVAPDGYPEKPGTHASADQIKQRKPSNGVTHG